MNETTKIATFAGGCFWCMEPPFDKLDGVISTVSGYTGGRTVDPTYEEVSSGTTGHAESLQVTYDPSKIGYEKLLDVFWHNIDPLARDRQFCDIGEQYRSAIFYHDEEQKRLAEASKRALEQSGRLMQPIATQICRTTPPASSRPAPRAKRRCQRRPPGHHPARADHPRSCALRHQHIYFAYVLQLSQTYEG
jgi:methionine-S-sulfoxide reductase